ncbi:hypothetical protein AB3Y40_16840 [Yoonia sp. R2331]
MPESTTDAGQIIHYGAVFQVANAQGRKPPYELRPPKDNSTAF